MKLKALATDLDGTLVPLPNSDRNQQDLKSLQNIVHSAGLTFLFVTGRSPQLVQKVIADSHLPLPQWIICDVGTTILQVLPDGTFQPDQDYVNRLSSPTAGCTPQQLEAQIRFDGLTLQEPEKQGAFKLSYYTPSDDLQRLSDLVNETIAAKHLPWSLIASHCIETGRGLIDLLPQATSKASALEWWAERHGFAHAEIAFAGDSGNDLAALTAGFRAIVVHNAHPDIAEQVHKAHVNRGLTGRLFRCTQTATSGVLEGLRHFMEADAA